MPKKRLPIFDMCEEPYDPSKLGRYVTNTRPLEMLGVALEKRELLPNIPAVYFVFSRLTGLLYVGRTSSLRERWAKHHRLEQFMYFYEVRIAWITFPDITNGQLMDLEEMYIKYLNPRLNQTSTRRDPFEKRSLKHRSIKRRALAKTLDDSAVTFSDEDLEDAYGD